MAGFSSNQTSHGWLSYLDGWRALAIIGVLAGHFFPIDGFDTGRFGVEMFFALSGRLMASMLFINGIRLDTFFVRRIARVWPARLAFIYTVALITPFFSETSITPSDLLAVLTFTANYHGNQFAPAVNNVWSLCVEEWSYIILAIVALLTKRRAQYIAPILFDWRVLAC